MKKPSGSLISYFSNLVKSKGGINLAQGTPGFEPPPELLETLEHLVRGETRLHQYPPGNGDFRLLELIAEHYYPYSRVQPDNVVVVQGATEGLALVFLYLATLIKGKYSVLAFDPPYESYPKLAQIYKIPFEFFDYSTNLSIDFDKLEHTIRNKNVKVIMIASPGNPLAKIWNRTELEKICMLAEKYRCYIIFDAVYQDIYFEFTPFNPLAIASQRLFYINSFSKMLSITGWRIGYVIAVASHMSAIRQIHDYTGLCAPTLFQRALAEYLENNNYGADYTSVIRSRCQQSSAFLQQHLRRHGFKVPDLQGGYFLWAALPATYRDAFDFAIQLYQVTQVAVVPGENFSPNKVNYIRLNFATEMPIIHKAVKLISEFFHPDLRKDAWHNSSI